MPAAVELWKLGKRPKTFSIEMDYCLLLFACWLPCLLFFVALPVRRSISILAVFSRFSNFHNSAAAGTLNVSNGLILRFLYPAGFLVAPSFFSMYIYKGGEQSKPGRACESEALAPPAIYITRKKIPPLASRVALRAWCIFHFQAKGLAEMKHLRRSWLARQQHKFGIDMMSLGGVPGGTGNDKANQ